MEKQQGFWSEFKTQVTSPKFAADVVKLAIVTGVGVIAAYIKIRLAKNNQAVVKTGPP